MDRNSEPAAPPGGGCPGRGAARALFRGTHPAGLLGPSWGGVAASAPPGRSAGAQEPRRPSLGLQAAEGRDGAPGTAPGDGTPAPRSGRAARAAASLAEGASRGGCGALCRPADAGGDGREPSPAAAPHPLGGSALRALLGPRRWPRAAAAGRARPPSAGRGVECSLRRARRQSGGKAAPQRNGGRLSREGARRATLGGRGLVVRRGRGEAALVPPRPSAGPCAEHPPCAGRGRERALRGGPLPRLRSCASRGDSPGSHRARSPADGAGTGASGPRRPWGAALGPPWAGVKSYTWTFGRGRWRPSPCVVQESTT